jgi:hypothetical protein
LALTFTGVDVKKIVLAVLGSDMPLIATMFGAILTLALVAILLIAVTPF